MHAHAHDCPLVGPHALDDLAQVRGEPVDELWRELELHELTDEVVTHLVDVRCIPAVLARRVHEAPVRAPHLAEPFCGLQRVRSEIDFFLVVVLAGRRALFRRGDLLFLRVRIDVAGEQVGELRIARLDPLVLGEQCADGRRVGGQRGKRLVQALFDALGDLDLAFAGEKVDRAHLAHVHAHGVGGASELAVDGGEGGGRLLGLVIVRVDRRPHEQERIGIGRHFVHGDAHVVDHRDDVFDLLRVDDTFGQVIVDLRIREVSLLFPLCNQ